MDSLEEEQQQEEDEDEDPPKKIRRRKRSVDPGVYGNKILFTIWLI